MAGTSSSVDVWSPRAQTSVLIAHCLLDASRSLGRFAQRDSRRVVRRQEGFSKPQLPSDAPDELRERELLMTAPRERVMRLNVGRGTSVPSENGALLRVVRHLCGELRGQGRAEPRRLDRLESLQNARRGVAHGSRRSLQVGRLLLGRSILGKGIEQRREFARGAESIELRSEPERLPPRRPTLIPKTAWRPPKRACFDGHVR
jgi:hypothetical protein